MHSPEPLGLSISWGQQDSGIRPASPAHDFTYTSLWEKLVPGQAASSALRTQPTRFSAFPTCSYVWSARISRASWAVPRSQMTPGAPLLPSAGIWSQDCF